MLVFSLQNFLSCITFIFLFACFSSVQSQPEYIPSKDDSSAVKSILIEKYFTSDNTDIFSDDSLESGSVTYRFFVELKPGYSLQMVYGNAENPLFFNTSTYFYNNEEIYAATGFNIDSKKIHLENHAFDSWITLGTASRLHIGIPLFIDKDGSLIPQKHSLSEADGLTIGIMPKFEVFNLNLQTLRSGRFTKLFTDNGGWAALGGISVTQENPYILIAQLTTTGEISYNFNLQLANNSGNYFCFVSHVSKNNNDIVLKVLTNNSKLYE